VALLAQWPAYVAYLTSFVTIGILWVNHHSLFEHVRHVDRPLMFVNLLLLLFVSVIPFPTALLGRYATAGDDSHLAAAIYGSVMFVVGLAFSLLWGQVTTDRRGARAEGVLFSTGLVLYLVGVGVSLISAQLGMLVYALLAVFYVFPWLPRAGSINRPTDANR
jgi:uncharacterized membrane protein